MRRVSQAELPEQEMSGPSDTRRYELGARKWAILRAVVEDYVETAEPVGSEALVQRYKLGIKPATVRNEMAEMSELGYLKQPHTSAGRVPSDIGYRYFVDRLEPPAEPEAETRSRLREISRAGDDLATLLAESCRLLARMSRYIALATTAAGESVFVRQVIVSPVTAERLLVVMVLSDGRVENRTVEIEGSTAVTDLAKLNELINLHTVGWSLRELARRKTPELQEVSPTVETLFHKTYRELRTTARALSRGSTVHDGIVNLLSQPEFRRDIASLEEVLAVLETGTLLDDVLDHEGPAGSCVVIGSESRQEALAPCSIVASRFYVGDREAGTIGVLGPSRMRYAAAVSLVRYTSQVLSETLTKMFYG